MECMKAHEYEWPHGPKWAQMGPMGPGPGPGAGLGPGPGPGPGPGQGPGPGPGQGPGSGPGLGPGDSRSVNYLFPGRFFAFCGIWGSPKYHLGFPQMLGICLRRLPAVYVFKKDPKQTVFA